jgi:flagellar hook-basal body complex protein FliE
MADFTTIISNTAARGAYRSSQQLTTSPTGTPQLEKTDQQGSFADMVRDAAEQAIRTARQADEAAQLGMKGELDTQKVVEATIALESTVKVAVSMRDKFVEAYQEVLRMPI